ncbi:MAG TPA: aspartate aminotransferase family protein [Parasegetibacter sp.]
MNQRQLFLQHVAQTSASPLALEMVEAKGCKIRDVNGKEYIDLIAGISVCNVGHCHPEVVDAIKSQAESYLHLIVYGEFIQSPQVQYATRLTSHLPENLNCVYFTNSGAEAIEGAMKLAKRITNKTEIIAFKNSYHGSTQGALSIIGDEYWRNAFRPLLPGVIHARHNSMESLNSITSQTACVIAEVVQAEAGVKTPSREWITALRRRCSETGALLVFDEVQTGFGRTGSLWSFEQFGVVPDILVLGKALGAGMPLGAFIASREMMQVLTDQPVLGHITTFGGHPVSCAAGLAGFRVLLRENYIADVKRKEALFLEKINHPSIKKIYHQGLWLALDFGTFGICKQVIDYCIANGLITDWFLFAPECMRIGPPLSISDEEIIKACEIINSAPVN